jgi:hypothetical protein
LFFIYFLLSFFFLWFFLSLLFTYVFFVTLLFFSPVIFLFFSFSFLVVCSRPGRFVDGSDNIIPHDTEVHPRPIVERRLAAFEKEGRLLTPNFTSTDFATGQDYANHFKLMRLFEEYVE